MKSLESFDDLELRYVIYPNGRDALFLRPVWDADHAGLKEITAKSISGYVVWLRGLLSRGLLGWCAKFQGSTARNATGAEITAGADCLCRMAFPLRDRAEDVWGREVGLHAGTDNAAALLDIPQGWSKSMRYLRKRQCASLSLTSETLDLSGNPIGKVNTDENESDLLTKALGAWKHWKFILKLGLE